MDEPMIRVWIQDAQAPSPAHTQRPGRWVGLPGWPAKHAETLTFHVAPDGLADTATDASLTLRTPETTGWTAPNWVAYGVNPDGPLDQNGETGLAPFFETPPLDRDLDILGFPTLAAMVESDVSQANIAAVLSSVAPDGRATLVSFGVLNLTHRAGHADPQPMPIGQPVAATVQLNVIGQQVPAGHRLRLALSQAYWPLIWPSAEKATLKITKARLSIPLVPEDAVADLPPLPPAEGAQPAPLTELAAPAYRRERRIDCVTGLETTLRHDDRGTFHHAHTGLTIGVDCHETYAIHPDTPTSATGTCRWQWRASRGDWHATLDTRVSVTALATVWRIAATLTARDADGIVAERHWSEDIPRDLV
jgi:predicted acyl esterase